jgi:predicted RNase H-like HicB family nuclease
MGAIQSTEPAVPETDFISHFINDGRILADSGGCRIKHERHSMRRRTIQVRIFRGEKKYVAECLDLPVVTQGDTLDEVTANVREAIDLHLEGEDLAELGIAEDAVSVLRYA